MVKKLRKIGFTLLEALVVIAIMAILSAFSVPVYQKFQVNNDLQVAAESLVGALRRAQLQSQSGVGDSAWGVAIESNNIIIFKGNTYAGRDTNYDEVLAVPTSQTFSGTTEYNFAKTTGLLSSAMSTTITSNVNETRTVSVNAKGMIQY